MLLRLKQSQFDNPFIKNGMYKDIYGISVIDADKIKDYISYINNYLYSEYNRFSYTQKNFHKNDIFLKVDEIKYFIFSLNEEVKAFKLFCNNELFWAFDYHFEEV